MSEQSRKVANAINRRNRTRATMHGTAERPRLSVIISNRHISAQLINDDTSKSMTAVSTAGKPIKGTMTERATALGVEFAKKAKTIKVSKIVLDRGDKKYHGRIKAFADAARENGLEF